MLNISKRSAYILLIISIVFEITGSVCLEACDAFRNEKISVLLILCYFVSFTLFAKILQIIDLAVAYATWTALGSIALSIAGVIFFHQDLTIAGWISIFTMGFGVFMLNLYGSPEEEEKRKAKKNRRKEQNS